ncbi:hypothetical protein ACFL13_01380 [Patescibacteria group bacterium]
MSKVLVVLTAVMFMFMFLLIFSINIITFRHIKNSVNPSNYTPTDFGAVVLGVFDKLDE